MCSIIGIRGSFKTDKINQMIQTLRHRGPDAFGIYFNEEVIYNQYLNDAFFDDSLVLAHNLLSIVGNTEMQPIVSDNLILVSNAELYNYRELIERYNISDLKSESDCEVIVKVIEYYYNQNGNNLKDAVLKSIECFDGDYAFCIMDENNYVVIRDNIGVKPVYYVHDDEFFAFASEQKALKRISDNPVHNLNPRCMIYNDEIIRIREDYKRKEVDNTYDEYKELIKNALIESVEKRVRDLDKVSLLFSGGVDSTLIAVILKRLNVDFTCYTIGTENSQDLRYAKKISHDMDIKLKYNIISQEDVEDYFYDTVNAIEDTNLMKIGVGMTMNMTAHLASLDNHKVILSGQGADELFCGYNRYKNKYDTPEKLLDELTENLNDMYHVNLERDDKACMNNSLELRVPYLDRKVIKLASQLPLEYMIHSNEDNIRKHILRDIAYELGMDEEIAYRPKKAAQYATGIDKIIKKKLRKKEEYQKFFNKQK